MPRRIVRTCIYGLTAALVAVLFQLLVQWIFEFTMVRFSRETLPAFLVGSFVVLVGSSLGVGYLLTRFCPEAAGSGIPQLKVAYWKDFGYVPWRVVWVKFVAGALSIGGGSSLGREGPSVQIGGGVASNVAGLLGEAEQDRREAAAAGAAAGLAAAFNAPIAAVTFVLEEIIQNLNSRALGGVLIASIIGAFTTCAIVGTHPSFIMPQLASPSWIVYALTPLIAAAAAVVGIIFQVATLRLRKGQLRATRLPAWLFPGIAGILTWAIGGAVFASTGHLGVFGLGYGDLSEALDGNLLWKIAGVLLVAKLIATILCYGLGGCGGIFAPNLFFGAMTGLFLTGLVKWAVPHLGADLDASQQIVLAVVGMSACLGAVVRAPMTSILIVFEMTDQFSVVPALILGALVSQVVGRFFCKTNFYDALLVQDDQDLSRFQNSPTEQNSDPDQTEPNPPSNRKH